MTLIVTGYNSKRDLKASIGQPLQYMEYGLDRVVLTGSNTVANRPHLTHRGREFFAEVYLKDGIIESVK